MGLMALTLGKVTERSMRNNQIREFLQRCFASAEEDVPSLRGWEGRDPTAWSGPDPWATWCQPLHWCPEDEAANGPGHRADPQGLRGALQERGGVADVTALWLQQQNKVTLEHATTASASSQSWQSIRHTHSSSRRVVSLFYPVRAHCLRSSVKTNSLWQAG